MRTFYSEYVQHCMRFYSRHSDPEFRTEVDKLNWKACESALKAFADKDRELLLEIYRRQETVAEGISNIANAKSLDQNDLWKLVGDLERKVAKRRNLI